MSTVTVPTHILKSMLKSMESALAKTNQESVLNDETRGFPYAYGYLYSTTQTQISTLEAILSHE